MVRMQHNMVLVPSEDNALYALSPAAHKPAPQAAASLQKNNFLEAKSSSSPRTNTYCQVCFDAGPSQTQSVSAHAARSITHLPIVGTPVSQMSLGDRNFGTRPLKTEKPLRESPLGRQLTADRWLLIANFCSSSTNCG